MAKIMCRLTDNRGITFLATDNKNCVLAGLDDNRVCGGFVHTELKIKIVVHDSPPPTDISHHPAGQEIQGKLLHLFFCIHQQRMILDQEIKQVGCLFFNALIYFCTENILVNSCLYAFKFSWFSFNSKHV